MGKGWMEEFTVEKESQEKQKAIVSPREVRKMSFIDKMTKK